MYIFIVLLFLEMMLYGCFQWWYSIFLTTDSIKLQTLEQWWDSAGSREPVLGIIDVLCSLYTVALWHWFLSTAIIVVPLHIFQKVSEVIHIDFMMQDMTEFATSKSVPASTRLEDQSKKRNEEDGQIGTNQSLPYSTVFSVSRPMDPLVWLAGLLALSGDVETNPGPTTQSRHHLLIRQKLYHGTTKTSTILRGRTDLDKGKRPKTQCQ